MSAFKKVPELDWVKDLAESMEADGEENSNDVTVEVARKMDTLYRYLLWMRRASLTSPQSPEHKVADGLCVKYHRRLYGIPMTDFEKKYVAEAEAGFKKMKRG